MKLFSRFLVCLLLGLSVARASEGVFQTAGGTLINTAATDKLGAYGATPITQRTSANQAAVTDTAVAVTNSTGGSTANTTLAAGTITDSTGGSATTTIAAATNTGALTDSTTGTGGTTTFAAGVGVNTVTIPIQLASMTTAAADLVTTYVPGYKFKLLSLTFATTTLGTGTSASQVLNLAISGVATTGGVLTVTLNGASTGTDVLGKLSAATAITAANTGASTDSISLKVAASGTVFTAGAGVVLIKIQNMDSADAIAGLTAQLALQRSLNTVLINGESSLAAQTNVINTNTAKLSVVSNAAAADAVSLTTLGNELRTSLVNLGFIKGQ